jgi:hypothetical protein
MLVLVLEVEMRELPIAVSAMLATRDWLRPLM